MNMNDTNNSKDISNTCKMCDLGDNCIVFIALRTEIVCFTVVN